MVVRSATVVTQTATGRGPGCAQGCAAVRPNDCDCGCCLAAAKAWPVQVRFLLVHWLVQSVIGSAVTGDRAERLQCHVLPTDDPVRAMNILREAAGLQPLSDEHDDRAAEPVRTDFERREPRCRICRDESVRVLVNKLLDWQGAPIILGRGKTHLVTYADILRDLEPLNKGRDKRDRITYDSLWVHAKRHYDDAAITAYWRARMHKELMNALRG
jgi:hypothetical protein